jgi:hypothetical protein
MRRVALLLVGLTLGCAGGDDGDRDIVAPPPDSDPDADPGGPSASTPRTDARPAERPRDGDASTADASPSDASTPTDATTPPDSNPTPEMDGAADACRPTTFYRDLDGDGHGDPSAAIEACSQPDGHVPVGDDCFDGDEAIHPGAPERCDNRQDDDCDDEADERACTGCVPGRERREDCYYRNPTDDPCVTPSQICRGDGEGYDCNADDPERACE